ncbi:esterase, putative [Oceanicola granulosus HTCC2516]|uniref:Esterase, putative n=1 Tax=Oceanicola granulosus (strain ATCC BAA-861 / DSM 15982 / KCTC 12143 / HTCC2516) TaxID=314256 RepID=Q2CEA4_OCEGH|nr:alpha/beta hydrolase [Oceanicola granulosus]EAR50956.1 esterase, putative [Oceanicola granulosus HTCC2516]
MKLALLLLLAVVAAGLATRYRASERESAAEAAYPPTGELVEIDDTTVHAVIMGEGPDLVLIHGSSGNTRDFTFRLAPMLAERYRVIIFDRPGLGYTDRLEGDEGIVAQAALLQQAAAALGAERPIVLGQSYGGAVALAWGVTRPDSLAALVTVSAPSQRWDGPLPWLYRINSSALGRIAVPLITAWVPRSYVTEAIESIFAPQDMPEGYAEHIGAGLTLRRESLRANAAHRATLKEELAALAPRYGEIDVPLEIVHGTADNTVPFRIHATPLAEAVDGANLVALEGIGHVPHNVVPDAVAAAVDRAAARAGLR